jgi:hypothetical protein
MNKIYMVKIWCKDTITGVNVVVQGKDLSPEGAEKIAKKSIMDTGGKRLWDKLNDNCNLRDVIDITDREVLIDGYYGDI